MSGEGDRLELELIAESVFRPEAEAEARRSLLLRIYREVAAARGELGGRAPSGGLLAPVPRCVAEALESGEPCGDDERFTYNAVRVMMARYMVRAGDGRFLETPSMVLRRVALGFAGAMGAAAAERLYRLMVEGRFLFNSPTLFNMYSDGARGTLSACYVTPVGDSMEEIMDAARVQALTFKWGGGQGFSFSELRPRWDTVRGTSGQSSGPLSFMRLYDTVTELVKQGGKRRGANMGIMHVWHPDIYTPGFDGYAALRNMLPPQVARLIDAVAALIRELEGEGYEVDPGLREEVERLARGGPWTVEDAGFIQAKKPPLQDANLTNFNISVGVNDAFMEAVLSGGDWWMVNPRHTADPETGVYRIHYSVSRATGLGRLGRLLERHPWLLGNPYLNIYEDVLSEALPRALGELERQARARGSRPDPGAKNVHAWRHPARELWRELVEAAWGGGDPGVVYLDNHNKWNPTPWLGAVVATNPCSEQPLYPFESCNLGSINLARYVDSGRFDVEGFFEDVQLLADAMDRVIDLNRHPDPRQEEANRFTRKVGLGVMGLADALSALGLPYDSEEAVAFTLAASAALEAFAWRRSWELGAERGHAPAFECRRFDWRSLRCLEPGSPEELAGLHTPALVKAAEVAARAGGWLELRYRSVSLPGWARGLLERVAPGRVSGEGHVRLVRLDALDRVMGRVFGAPPRLASEALGMGAGAAGSPRHLLALAVYSPGAAWEALRLWGGRLGARAPRNTVMTTVAPTGTISILAGTSSGIEPYFALVYRRQVAVGTFLEVVRRFRDDLLRLAEATGAGRRHVEEVYEAVREAKGSLRRALAGGLAGRLREAGAPEAFVSGLERLARLYPTAMDFPLWYHVAHQAAAQLYVDQAISKTVNLPSTASPEDVEALYLLAWLAGLKGFTVYRDESKATQVIVFGGGERAGGRLLRRRAPARLATPRRRLTAQEAGRDPKLRALFKAREREDSGEVVVELTENSTCKTCER
jgi:ribonucleoside-diphosphate reductase alpha chain